MKRTLTRHHTARFGFTVIELLVTAGIVGVLLALLLPAVLHSRAAARSLECTSRMKQLGIAGHQFYDTNDRYPDVFSEVPWTVHFLPYLEEPDLTAAIKEALETNDTAAVMTHGQIVVPMFVCPESSGQPRSLAGLAFGSYALNFEVCVSNEAGACLDGRSNTVLATEMERNREPWLDGPVRIMEPLDSAHDHISHILLCDGAVRAISIETDPSILQALETPNGGEVVGAF